MILIGQPLTELPRGLIKTAGGWRTVYRYRGIRSACEGLIQQLASQYDEVELDPIEGDYCEVRAFNNGPEDGQQESAVVTVEMRGALVEQSVELNGYFAGLSDATLHHVNRILQNTSDADPDYDPFTDLNDTVEAAEIDAAWYLLKLKRKGFDTTKIATHYVTRTLSVSSGYPTAINTTNLNKLWTPDQLSAYIGGQTLFNIGTWTPTAGQTALGLAFRWHQEQAEAVITSSGGWQLVEGWQSGFWNTNLYDSV